MYLNEMIRYFQKCLANYRCLFLPLNEFRIDKQITNNEICLGNKHIHYFIRNFGYFGRGTNKVPVVHCLIFSICT